MMHKMIGRLALLLALVFAAPASADNAAGDSALGLAVRNATAISNLPARNNPFDPCIWKLANGQSCVVQFWTDSTGVDGDPANGATFGTTDRRWVGQWADQLITTGRLDAWSSGAGLRIHRWVTGSQTYDDTNYLETLRSSTNGVYLDIYLAAVSGSEPRYLMGSRFQAALGVIPADTLIISHGINMNTYVSAVFAGHMQAAIEQYRLPHPIVSIGVFPQHPNRDSTAYDAGRAIMKANGNLWGVTVVDGPYADFLAAGKPSTWYNSDGIHESPTLGVLPYIKAMNALWDAARTVQAQARPSALSRAAGMQQLVVNGGFSTWTTTTSVPDGWTLSGGPVTFSKSTTIYPDQRQPYSVRAVAASGANFPTIQQSIPIANLAGKPITCAALVRKDTAGSSNIGRLQVTYVGTAGGTVNVSDVAYILQADGFAWQVLTVTLPTDLTSLLVKVNVDAAATPDTTYGIWLDQVSCVAGTSPASFR